MNSITVKPELDELYTLNEFISDELGMENLQVNLIVEEIFVNIVNYSKTEFIIVNAEYIEPTLTLEFIDNGDIDEAQIGGLGIFLTKELADELDYHYTDGENHLEIVKIVKQ